MRSIVTHVLTLCLLPFAAGCVEAGQPGGNTLKLEACSLPGVGKARCGHYTVKEDRGLPDGRTLDLNIVVLPARKEALPDPILFLHGGPGGAATALAPVFARSPWRDRRDIVLIDQRGTGDSGGMDCPHESVGTLLAEIATFDVANVSRCRERMDANLSRYTTSIAVDDFEEVRQALGVSQLNLIGGSYGTRVALEYLRRYPQSVRTAMLRGVAPPSYSLPSDFDHDSLAALQDVIADCAGDARCAKAFPELQGELDEVLTRLEETPGTSRIRDPLQGGTIDVTVTRQLFAASLHYSLYLTGTAARIPYWIHQAHGGEFDGLIGATARFAAALAPQLSMGAFLSVTCAEDVPFYDPAKVVREARDTPLRGVFSETLARTCQDWPVERVDAAFKKPVSSSVPVLLISGEADPVTPPRIAEEVAGHLEHSLHLVLKDIGHSDMAPGCVGDIVGRFIDTASVENLDTGCTRSIGRPGFRLE